LLLAACSAGPLPTAAAHVDSPEHFLLDPTPTALPPSQRIIIRTVSLSLLVEDTAAALTELQQAVEDAGGFVVSASSWSSPDSPGYSSLSARVPPEALSALRRAALEGADQVQSDSMYSQDATSQYRLLHKRLQDLIQAQEHIWTLLVESRDPRQATSLTMVRDLLQSERTSVEGQLASYDEQSTLASFDVTFNQPAAIFAPQE
jgi:hypothetical protein